MCDGQLLSCSVTAVEGAHSIAEYRGVVLQTLWPDNNVFTYSFRARSSRVGQTKDNQYHMVRVAQSLDQCWPGALLIACL